MKLYIFTEDELADMLEEILEDAIGVFAKDGDSDQAYEDYAAGMELSEASDAELQKHMFGYVTGREFAIPDKQA